MNGTALVLAAGGGERLGAGPKGFVELAGVPLLRRAATAAASAERVEAVVLVVPPGSEDRASALLADLPKFTRVVAGGPTRQASAALGLEAAPEAEAIVLHDAARALCPPALFDRCLEALDDVPAALAAVPVTDTIKLAVGDLVDRTLDRTTLAAAQTPQAFRREILVEAHREAVHAGFVATDDVALVERLGHPVRIVPGDARNLKITTPVDLRLAELLLEQGR